MKTIFIDFGNVIGFFDHRKTTSKLLPFTDMPEQELFELLYGSQLEIDFESGKVTTEQYIEEAMKTARLTCTPDLFLNAFNSIFTKNLAVCEMLPKLAKRYRLILASNTNESHYKKYSGQFSYELSQFAFRCPSHHVGHRKPSEEYYLHCQRFAAAAPYQCLFIDDMKVNVVAAQQHMRWNGLVYDAKRSFVEQLEAAGIALDA